MYNSVNKSEVEKQIAALKNKISYLKSKRTKVCAKCGKEFVPVNSMKERYCSDACRKLAIQETKHKVYLKNRENPEYIKKMKEYKHAWLEKNGKLKPKQKTVSLEEYNKLEERYYVLEKAYDKLFKRNIEILEQNERIIKENHILKSKSFIQKLKDLF